jgi:hypothetical protein
MEIIFATFTQQIKRLCYPIPKTGKPHRLELYNNQPNYPAERSIEKLDVCLANPNFHEGLTKKSKFSSKT